MTRSDALWFVAYLLLACGRWVLELVWPSQLRTEESSLLASVLAVAVVFGFPKSTGGAPAAARWGTRVFGVLLFACAWTLSDRVGTGIPFFTRAALLTLVSVAVVLAWSAQDGSDRFLPLLASCLAGVGGAFLLLPADLEDLHTRPWSAAAFLLLICGLGIGSAVAYRGMREMPRRTSFLLVVAPGVLVNGVLVASTRAQFKIPGIGDLPGILWQAAEIGCLLVLLRRVRPVPLSARFLLVPLLGAVSGWVYLRPALTWRLGVGAVLLVSGAVGLLREDPGRRDSSLSLL